MKRHVKKYAGQIVALSISDGFIKNVNGVWATGVDIDKNVALTHADALRAYNTTDPHDDCNYWRSWLAKELEEAEEDGEIEC